MNKHIICILLFWVVSVCGMSQNTSNISGSFDIGPVGNATYNIPVDLPSGTAGVKPDVSIVYNSFSGDGVMGKGFSLSAISSITRVNSTVFHSGYISDIEFDDTDKYMLDGNRLIYDGMTQQYRTEINPYSQIKIFSPNTSSAHFEVRTKDGLIMEYGNTTDSRLCAQSPHTDQVAFWMLSKVRDRVGNYYTYTYDKDETNGEIRLKQIDYTGNAGSMPYCTVKFVYTSRNYDVNLNYIQGSKFKESKLLSEIGVYYGASLYRKYSMTYNYDGNDFTYLLSKITVTGLNNEVLKPIVFDWYKNTDYTHEEVIHDQSTNAQNYINKAYISLGDYNGDGRTDLLATPMEDADWTGWKLFCADTDGNKLSYFGSGTLPERYKEPVAGDFNGDGITDFLACRETVSKSFADEEEIPAVSGDSLSSDSEVSLASVTYYNYFIYYGTGSGFKAGPAITTESRPHSVRVADFNGDGAMDLFIYYTSKNGSEDYKIYMSGYSSGTMTAFKTTSTGRILSEMNWDQVEVWDFDGDGLAEIMNLRDDGYDYLDNSGNGSMYRTRTGSLPTKKHKICFGDFNGDRKIDLLLTGWNNTEWSEWLTLLSTGAEFERYYFPKKFAAYSKDIYVCDLNGDGCDDFFAVDKTSNQLSALKCFIGYDNGRNFKEYASVTTYGSDKWNFYPIDTRGDGKLGFIKTMSQSSASDNSISTGWTWSNGSPANSMVLRTETTGDGQVVKTWYDAMGREIQTSHKNFSGKEVYTTTSYDAQGRAIKVSEPYFSGGASSSVQYHTSQYDDYGRISKQITPLGTISYNYSGNQTTIVDGTKGYTTVRETDAGGKLKTVTDPGGKITYTYGPTGDVAKVVCGSAVYSMEYDLLGRRTKLVDPNAGTILYEYDGWGNLKKQTDARGEVEEYTYENSGRLQSYKRGTETFSYAYDPTYKGQVGSITYGGAKTEFRYGTYGRLTSKIETVDNRSFQFSYVYNSKGQLETTTYPNSKSIKYEYVNGDLYKIIWQPSQTTVWQKNDENAKGQVLTTALGNGMQGIYAYNTIGVPTSIKATKETTSLLNIGYQNIDARGNIMNRNEQSTSQSENFTYDSMNRLTTGVEYDENGNILFKADAGTYQYEASHPHAISSLSPTSNEVLPKLDLSVTYNSVRLPVRLSEGDKTYTLTYNGENSRVKSQFVQNGSTVFTKYYCGPYEEIQKGGTTRKNYYIYGDGQIVAVYTEGTSDAGMYYFHNDHLGSPWLITNASGNEVQRLNFNAWGLRRDATNWDNYSDLPEMKFDRGFTGHEHLEMFGLINMNARLYDPVLGRFLSPDPVIQIPEFTQSYNGYSYALNNPLSYKDPNGESFILVAAIIGGWIGMGTAMVSSDKGGWGLAGDMLKGLFVGAASGAAGAWVGGAVAGSITAGGFINGSLSGLAGGFSGGFVGCSGNAWLSGAGFGAGLKAGLIGGGLAAAFGGVSGGLIRGFSDMAKGYSFWDGRNTSGFVIGTSADGNVMKQAENYNSSISADVNDDILKSRYLEEFNIKEGDLGIKEITTKAGRNIGMSQNGEFVDVRGVKMSGYIDRYTTGKSTIHISHKYVMGDIVDFRAVAGHELTHSYHAHFFKSKYVKSFSESVAYRYTAQVYMNAGRYQMANSVMNIAKQYGYYPQSYSLQGKIKSMWFY